MSTVIRYTIGVMGSASGVHDEATMLKMVRLGRVIAERGFVRVTGRCPEPPHAAARAVQEAG